MQLQLVHTHTHTAKHNQTHDHRHEQWVHKHVRTRMREHSHVHASTCARTHARTRARTHAHTYTHLDSPPCICHLHDVGRPLKVVQFIAGGYTETIAGEDLETANAGLNVVQQLVQRKLIATNWYTPQLGNHHQ